MDVKDIGRLKKKWQIAFRRFIIQGQPAKKYSEFYGITRQGFRSWIEAQFIGDMSWGNYGQAWDIDHRIPACYFDYSKVEDLLLLWNFLNVRPAVSHSNRNKSSRLDIASYYSFFSIIGDLYKYETANRMVHRIEELGLIMKDPVSSNIHAFMLLNRIDWENFYQMPSEIGNAE